MKIKLKIITGTQRMKNAVSDDLREYIKKPNEKYEFISMSDNPDIILCHDFKIWRFKYPKIICSNKNIITNVIVLDRFKLNNKTPLRRLYLGTLSLKNTLEIPFIEGRAEKLINEYNVDYSKNFIFNKKGVIVICPNRHMNGWYKFLKSSLSSLEEIERNIKIIKENSNLDIEIRIHPQTYEDSINNLLKKYNIKINNDDIETLSKRSYCIIADRSSIATKMYLKGNIIFNFQEDYEHSIIGKACLRNPQLLNPDNLKEELLPDENMRYNYLQFIATQTYTDYEINNGYLLNILYPILLENKDKLIKF